jgi:hypothetical protein
MVNKPFHDGELVLEHLWLVVHGHIRMEGIRQFTALGWSASSPSSLFHASTIALTAGSVSTYVRGNVHTNTVEGFYSIFKRGMRGVYQHCSEKHLHRYLVEFDFRYSNRVRLGINDVVRSEKLVDGVVGKRLTYRRAARREADEETIPF